MEDNRCFFSFCSLTTTISTVSNYDKSKKIIIKILTKYNILYKYTGCNLKIAHEPCNTTPDQKLT